MTEKQFGELVADLWRLRQQRTALASRRTAGVPMDELFDVQKKIQAACAALAQ